MPELNLDEKTWDTFQHKELTVHIAGHIVIGNKPVSGAEDLYEILSAKYKSTDLRGADRKGFLAGMSGNFVIIIKDEGFLFAAVDISRSYPVFYSGDSWKNLNIYDRLPMNLSETHKLNRQNVNEFFELGFITGEETIFEGISQLQAGEILSSDRDRDTVKKERYFTYSPSETPAQYSDSDEFVMEFDKLLMGKFNHLPDSFPGNTQWIVPLSGGHDSRLLINCLKRAGAENVVCFSYGNPGNEQSEISKMVAEAAGYEWIFIEYTEEKWKQLHDKGVIDEYVDYSFNGVSTPHFQDLLAVHELKRLNLIEKGAVFVPGHTSVSEVGFIKPDSEDPIDSLIKMKKRKLKSDLPTNLYDKISGLYQLIGKQPHLLSENFDWQENQAKYINNSVHVYRFFGYKFALPLWYKEVADFWLKLPHELSVNRNGLYIAEKNGVLIDSLVHIPFENEKKKKKFSFKRAIKKLIPSNVINIILSKSNHKNTHAEALNDVFALKGETIGDVLSPLDRFPDELVLHIQDIMIRRPHQISVYQLSKYYTLKKLFEQDKKKNTGDINK